MNLKPAHNQPANRPSRNAGRFSIAPASAGWENTLPPPGSERSGRWSRPFQPAFPASTCDVRARWRHSCRIATAGDNFLAYARALENAGENRAVETRGFTSCHDFPKMVLKTKPAQAGQSFPKSHRNNLDGADSDAATSFTGEMNFTNRMAGGGEGPTSRWRIAGSCGNFGFADPSPDPIGSGKTLSKHRSDKRKNTNRL
jgi:hypothetical protein